MDHGPFDELARLLGAAGSRRAALGALLGVGALSVAEAADARSKSRKRRNSRNRRKTTGRGAVSAQAVCAPPATGVIRNNCTYDGQNFSGQALHSSSYKTTTWNNATLVGADLHSSYFRGGSFRQANLCGANLHSSNLNADFAQADLTLADLHSSSGCTAANFPPSTIFCRTIDCAGNLRNDDCPDGPPPGFCCVNQNCGPGGLCVNNQCICTEPFFSFRQCFCLSRLAGGVACVQDLFGSALCDAASPCSGGQVCVTSPCFQNVPPGKGGCAQPCGDPAACRCGSGPTKCGSGEFVTCGDAVFAARSSSREGSSGIRLLP